MKNYYQILNVKPDATHEQINAAYEHLLDLQEKYPGAFDDGRRQDFDEAYDTLSDPDRRKAYDRLFWQDVDEEAKEYYPSSGLTRSRWVMPAHAEAEGCATEILKTFLWPIVVVVVVGVFFAILSGNDVSINPSSRVPTRTPRPIVTATEGVVPSPQAVQPTVSPAPGQRCLVQSKNNQPLQLLAEANANAAVLATIDPDTAFFGTWRDEWFEFDDSILGLPRHGFVRQTDIVAVNCY